MTRVAVVGAGGYVGGRLVEHLRTIGSDVVPVSRQPRPWLPGAVAVDLLTDPPDALDRALDGVDVVLHLAGHDEVVAARAPERALTETTSMTHRIAEAVKRVGASRVVYLSTIHVYGAQMVPGAVISEDTVPQPRAPYALARLASEHLLDGLLEGCADVVALRLTNSVGAPVAVEVDRWSLLVNDLCRQAVRSGRLVLQTPGLQHRDWVALGDVCRALTTATDAAAIPPGTYNLGSGATASVRDVAALVAERWTAATGEPVTVEAPATDQPAPAPYRVDVERLGSLGVWAQTPLPDAIDEVVRFCVDHRGALAQVA